ncbi:MAG: DUF4445 domain-containing protein [Deltaproteobacteria bacterium]|nr:MAG: DUF4445 domain-containing protein [Deltaproteobacteria bacterium]
MSENRDTSPAGAAHDTHRSAPGAQHCFLALDLGTTTLVGRLLAADGTVLAEERLANPQRPLGADILTRLQRARDGAADALQHLLQDGMRTLVTTLLGRAGVAPERIAGAAAAGNPGICHLLCRLPVDALIHPPHRSPLTALSSLPAAAADLGLPVPLQLFPAVSGFVGGDLVAVLYGLATQRLALSTQHCLVLDLGTNAELALRAGGRWLVTSAAAGPAFEAGNIACGMPLAPGAVTGVQLAADRLLLEVHGGGRPAGLCGSGLLALIAAARQGGLIDAGGRIVAPEEVGTNLARYLVRDGAGWAVRFHRDAGLELRLTQDDVRQLQLAKGAVRAGIDVLLGRAGLDAGEVAAVLITGAFGAALPAAALKGIAMLPEGMVDNSFFVPNGVLDGLGAFLADPGGAERLAPLLTAIRPLPLSGTPAFEKRFLAALEFA